MVDCFGFTIVISLIYWLYSDSTIIKPENLKML